MKIDNLNSPLEAFTSDIEMDIDEADAQSSGFSHRDQIIIDSGYDDGDESDTTLLGDDFDKRVVTPVLEAREHGRQPRRPDANFRELHSYTQNGRTIQVNEMIQDQDDNFLRVTSIKQHQDFGNIAIESVRDDHRILQTHSYSGRTLKAGKTVELTDRTFLRIVSILEDRRTGEISLKGFLFQRAVELDGLLPFKRNEVAMIMELDKHDPRNILEQSTGVHKLAAVVRIRELVKTNQQYPALGFRETDPESIRLGEDYMNDHCRLVCRWNYVNINKNEGFLRRVTDVESDEGCSVPQGQLRHAYRGATTTGGDSAGWLESEEAFDRNERMRCFFIDPLGFHSDSTDTPRNRRQQRRHTFGDGFCGAGGASRGAYSAGFRVEWGFDHDPHAIATYYANFPQTRCDGIAANDFVTAINEEYKIDVLHLSPPCQTFSPAHTRPGPNDERNEATFLATEELIKKTRPRIVTLEETFGLTRTLENLEWFNAMIHMFTKLGFSVRWKVFNLLDFGLPQPRRRLFLFASW